MHPTWSCDIPTLRARFPHPDIDFAIVHAPLEAPPVVEETWLVRATPVGSSGRVQVEARPHRRADWSSDPDTWPEEVRSMAKAKRDGQGRAVSSVPYAVWRALKGARAKARRVIEVALQAWRAAVVPVVAWVEARARTEAGWVSVRVPSAACKSDRQAFIAWVETRSQLLA